MQKLRTSMGGGCSSAALINLAIDSEHEVVISKRIKILSRRIGRPMADHVLDGEGGVFGAAEGKIGPGAGRREGEHGEEGQGAMGEGPGGEVHRVASAWGVIGWHPTRARQAYRA